MIQETISLDNAIEFMNELLSLDPVAISFMVGNRVPCSSSLGEHPTVQADFREGLYSVGLLGILNGLFGVDSSSYGPIEAVYSDSDLYRILSFRKRAGGGDR